MTRPNKHVGVPRVGDDLAGIKTTGRSRRRRIGASSSRNEGWSPWIERAFKTTTHERVVSLLEELATAILLLRAVWDLAKPNDLLGRTLESSVHLFVCGGARNAENGEEVDGSVGHLGLRYGLSR